MAPAITATEGTPTPTARKVGKFVGHFDQATHNFVIAPDGPPIQLSDTLEPTSADLLNQQYGSGSTTANTVDLVTTAVHDPFDGGASNKTFSATVQVRSLYSRSLANVWVYISSVQLAGVSKAGYNATNSDATNTVTTRLGINAAHGLWSYTNGSTNGPFLSPNSTLSNTCTPGSTLWCASRDWIFNNTNNENVTYNIEVYASEGFSSYTMSLPSALSWTEACPAPYSTGSGTAIGLGNTPINGIAVPFDFEIYNTNTSHVNLFQDGQITPGDPLASGGIPIDITETSQKLKVGDTAPAPVFFAFWDRIQAGTTTGQMCTTTVGAAPNRKFVIEWNNYDFNDHADGPNKGASLTFEAVLYEGTGEIDTLYKTMIDETATDAGTPGRAAGSKATVGMQNETITAFTQEHNNQDGLFFGTGTSYTFVPLP